jgi:hypothetical protein
LRESVSHRCLLATLLASALLSGNSLALEPSGNAVRVSPNVDASGVSGERILEVEGAVFMGDEIVASPNGLAQIRFIDNTRIVIGPNSRLSIDTFVFNPDHTARQVTINAIKGAFRFISGNSPHQAYSIRTPMIAVGLRGTVVDLNVRAVDSTALFVEGSGTVCDNAGTCVDATDDCTLHVVSADGGGVQQASNLEARLRLAAFFPFIADQSALAPAFRADIGSCRTGDNRFFGTPEEPYGRKHQRDRDDYSSDP